MSSAGSPAAPSSAASSAASTPAAPATSAAPSSSAKPSPLVHPTPASARNTATSSAAHSGTFTAPAASSAVQGWGSYQVINAHRVHVQVCAKKVGKAYAVGVEAIAYNSSSQQGEIASVILPETPGQQGCTQTYLLYTDHLKVYSFIGQGGTITKKSAMKPIY